VAEKQSEGGNGVKARKARGNFLLLLTAMIWGSSFVAQSAGADLISPAFFNGTRMLLGSLLLSPLAVYRMRRYVPASSRRTLLLGGACCGVLMFTGSYMQQTGIAYTTAGKAGFLTAMYVVLVPVLGIFLKKKPRPILWVSVALACVGLYFLCFTDKTFSLAMGDAAMLGGAVMFALHIMVVDHFSPLVDGVCLSFVQFLTAGSLGMVVAFITEQPSFAALSAAAVPILYTGVFTMGVAYTLQIVAQKDTDPTVASLILCMESVFAVVFGWLILHETLSLREGVGSVFMFVAILLAQLA
jgi:drug/metabolite transporter (DMT)-like permease